MRTLLLTWNPEKGPWDPKLRSEHAQRTAAGEPVPRATTTGGRKNVIPGEDRVFLMRLGTDPKGIVSSGIITSEVRRVPHTIDGVTKLANEVDVEWDAVLEDSDLLPHALLMERVPGVNWTPQVGGTLVPSPADRMLEELWSSHLQRLGRPRLR